MYSQSIIHDVTSMFHDKTYTDDFESESYLAKTTKSRERTEEMKVHV